MRVLLASVLLLSFLFAGCTQASDGDDGPLTSAPTTTAPGTTQTTAMPTPASGTSTTTSGTSSSASTTGVSIEGFAFKPKSVSVHVGDTVRWTQSDGSTHTVTSDAGAPKPFDSGDLTTSGTTTFEVTFDQAGTYAYHCARHGGMTGTVTVT